MRIINITPLLTEYKKEIITDLLWLNQNCGVTDIAFMMTLHPEGEMPAFDKARYLRDCFIEFKKELTQSELKVGILMQSTIGHGYALEKNTFQKIVRSNGSEMGCMCPLDKRFQNYIREAAAIVSKGQPDFMMVDDDFRLINGRSGCFCPLHLDYFQRMTGLKYDRETLLTILQQTDEASRKIGERWNECLSESLVMAAHEIRKGIDSVNPDISCGYCDCSADIQFAQPIARALQGKKPAFIRINNGRYMESTRGTSDVPQRMYHGAFQVKYLQGIPEILGESDTCPHNRFSTSARGLLAQIAGSLLIGCNGIKLWITRLGAFEPESGEAYRKLLKANLPFLHEMARLVPQVVWKGCVSPIPTKPLSNWNPITEFKQERIINWGNRVFGNMGIPVSYDGNQDQLVALCGDDVDALSDEDLRLFLSHGLLLDGSAAQKMCERGFSKYIGVEVSSCFDRVMWLRERYNTSPFNGDIANRTFSLFTNAKKVIPVNDTVHVLSKLTCCPWYRSPDADEVGAGQTLFENSLHGRVAVYAEVVCERLWENVDNLLDEIRKKQFISVLDWLNDGIVEGIITNDAYAYARYGVISTSGEQAGILYLLNLSVDPLEEISVRVSSSAVRNIDCLQADGKWKRVAWKAKNDKEITLKIQAETLQPVVLKII
jgi:hypothetical protein